MKAEEIIKKYRLNKSNWTHKGFHGILHFFFVCGEMAVKPLKEYYGDSHKITVFYFRNNIGDWYWNDEDMIRLRKSFIKKVNKNPKVLSKLVNDWHARLRILDQIMKKIDKTELSKLSNNKLIDIYEDWYNAYIREYGIAIGIQDSFSMHADQFLFPHFSEIIREHGMNVNDEYPLLIAPVEDSFILREYKNRVKLLKELKKGVKTNDPGFRKKLQNHVKKYHWVQNNYAKNTFLDEDYYLKQIKQMKKLNPDKEIQRLEKERKDTLSAKKRLIRKLRLDKESKNLIRIAEVFAYMQDERKKYVLMAIHYHDIFLKEVQKRLKLSRAEAEYTYIHELRDLFRKKKINKKIFRQRKKGVLVINTLKGYEVISGKLAQEVRKAFESDIGKVREIKGGIACKGKAKGTVKIVKKIHDLANVHDGAILVASMTRPEMVIAIKKAAAIITDEGGITSHAAVVSRELGIPCIIGTKIATKVLKDGDKVEVDANKGIVHIK
ncbi:PEP-utilizing enzyme [Thermoproteota archaeon]